jgi:uncharacterized protein (TIGR03084 family)
MDEVITALAAQHAELDGLLAGLSDVAWATPAPQCPGWSIADVVLHLAQTHELAVASAEDKFADVVAAGAGRGSRGDAFSDVDAAADVMVARERSTTPAALLQRWRDAAGAERRALERCDPHHRVQWVSGDLAARTLATTRLAETWIHSGDVADALGVKLTPTARLWHVARLAWRTLPYAFAREGQSLNGPVAVLLTAPDGSAWTFAEDGAPPRTTVEGPALDFCLVAGRRLDPAESALTATGVDADAVLALVRTYA